jgi:hypothetical protein
VEARVSQNYLCQISYQAPTPPVSIAKYEFSPAPAENTFHPGDTITFAFTTSGKSRPAKATLLASYKAPVGNREGSPFFNDANAVDILTFPTLTIGSRHGTWGLAVLFTVETTEDSHFFFLPDPEIIVGPE